MQSAARLPVLAISSNFAKIFIITFNFNENRVNFKTNKIKDIRETYLLELNKIYTGNEAASFLDHILEHRLGITRIQRALNPELRLSESDMLKVHFDVKELKKFRPIQYIFGETVFFGLQLLVDEHVLIPRPETEELVLWIVGEHKNQGPLSILDIGTGSGCIALALKKELPLATVQGCDVSADALKIAEKNAAANNLTVSFFLMDMLKPDEWTRQPQFDVIVSNPPYVTNAEKQLMQPNVLNYEPAGALFVSDEDPLVFYRSILHFAENQIRPGGKIYFEINERFGDQMIRLLTDAGYQNVELRKDLSGKDRMISGLKPF
ncbi:MAG: peptide chain release factor N(5)-glutamine methyltransferase [Bacteroidales bacterium]|nr:peptide chain release factor N(5)-glutamine methyltransferase [Bacteroidales bacterium]